MLASTRIITSNNANKLKGGNMNNINEIIQAVQNITNEEELQALNSFIVDKLRLIHSQKQFAAAVQFKIGDQVRFDSRRGPVEGTVIKINKKTIHVKDGMTTWKVSPSLLQSV